MSGRGSLKMKITRERAFATDGEVILPISRIRTIMKSSPDVVQIGHDALVIMTKAAEFFIQFLAQQAFNRRSSACEVDYRDLANYVQNDDSAEFLHEIIPHKVTMAELARYLSAATATGDAGGDDEESLSQ